MGSTPNTEHAISRHIDIAISSIHGLFNEGFIDSPIAHLSRFGHRPKLCFFVVFFGAREFLGEDFLGWNFLGFIGNKLRSQGIKV